MVQRVAWARVLVDGAVTALLGRPPGSDQGVGDTSSLPAPGLLCLVGVARDDEAASATALARRIFHLRVLDDEHGRMGASVAATGGGVVVVSQFTLYGDATRGRRPSWSGAAPRATAELLVAEVAAELGRLGCPVGTGRFGAEMLVELGNDGPVTILLEEPVGGRRSRGGQAAAPETT